MKRKLLALSAFIVVLSAFAVMLQKPINAFALENDNILYSAVTVNTADGEEKAQQIFGAGINYISANDISDFASCKIFDDESIGNLATTQIIKKASNGAYYAWGGNGYVKTPEFRFNSKFDLALINILPSPSYSENTFYYTSQSKYVSYNLAIVNGTSKKTYANCYTDSFMNDLNKLNEGTITAAEFIKSYGTHIVWSVDYGQTLNYVLKFYSDNANDSEFTDLAYAAAINGIHDSEYVKKYGNSYTFSYIGKGEELLNFKLKWLFDIGDTFDSGLLTEEAFIGYGTNDNGLVPIWEILPDEYADSATMIETEYNKQNAEFEKKTKDELAERRAAEAEAKAYFAEKEAAAEEAIKKALSEQSEEKGCASSFNSSWMIFLIPCAVAALLIKKKIYINNAKD